MYAAIQLGETGNCYDVPNGSTEEFAYWEAALEHYHHDRVDDAWRRISGRGIGEAGSYLRWYRLIEAEAITRLQSEVRELRPWLRLEVVPSSVQMLQPSLEDDVLSSCDWVAERLGWQHGSPTLVSVLAKEADAEWAVNPYGYCTDKAEFDKICLPEHLLEDRREFRQAIAHEYAHVVSLNLSGGHAPRWLEEAVSVLTEGEPDPEALTLFQDDPDWWLDPDDLEASFFLDADDEDAEDEVWMAYQQAGWIGRYLDEFSRPGVLKELLILHSEEGSLRNLKLALTGRSRTDQALRDLFGFSVPELFHRAYAALPQKL